jgi:tetratricopeptide (TPR) repeat protein
MARRLAGRGRYNEAMNEYQLALELDPNAPGVAEGMREVEAERQRGRASRSATRACARPTSPSPAPRG